MEWKGVWNIATVGLICGLVIMGKYNNAFLSLMTLHHFAV